MHSADTRILDPARGYKPLDIGNGAVAASIAADGQLLSAGVYHPVLGYLVLSAFSPFPDAQRLDQSAVRYYRASLARPNNPGLGLRFSGTRSEQQVLLLAEAIPQCRFKVDALEVCVTSWAPLHNQQAVPAVIQTWRVTNPTRQPLYLRYSWQGRCSLGRADYTQLTEAGSYLPASTGRLRLSFAGGGLTLASGESLAAAAIAGLPAGAPWECYSASPLDVKIPAELLIQPGETHTFRLIYALGQDPMEVQSLAAALAAMDVDTSLAEALALRRRRNEDLLRAAPDTCRPMLTRALHYALDCCALPVEEALCLLTDHQILPLSWTRDAYFILQGMSTGASEERLDLLRRHLRWLFATAQRPNGFWARAYFANGIPKDNVFQLDQQCYPLLELADYADLGGDLITIKLCLSSVSETLRSMFSRKAAQATLFATDETPADDPLPLPYHFSSHVLLWYTLRRLAALQQRWPFCDIDLLALSKEVRADVRRHLVVEQDGRQVWAYAADLSGSYSVYHDANDFPTVLAPIWGFCSADDPLWRATLELAFSRANVEGYYPEPLGGLGSVHTPGAWPLGDVQELIYARLTHDQKRETTVLSRLASTACWDGALPEARDPRTGAVCSRHWFAWPGAALLCAWRELAGSPGTAAPNRRLFLPPGPLHGWALGGQQPA